MKRRTFISSLAAAGAASSLSSAAEKKAASDQAKPFEVLSPPVIQNPTDDSFSVAWMISDTATGWVEWGTTKELGNVVKSAHHGLMGLSDYALSASVTGLPKGASIYYRIVTMPVHYKDAYSIKKGDPILGEIRKLNLPQQTADHCSLAMVSDTHDHEKTVSALATRINQINPDAVLWNGDAANSFNTPQQTARICLTPGQKADHPSSGGWASTRPLFFTLGNHDARGQAARALPEIMTPWPMDQGDPAGIAPTAYGAGRYCFVKRIGPLAIVCLDTGEDKPDSRDVWGGMAAYEPYREAQKEWLVQALKQPEIASAPYLVTFCHIPLRGRKGHNDGMGEKGYAGFSGFGQKLWMQTLIDAGCQMVVSGHTHKHRIDEPNKEFPLYQIVGGGPKESQACLIQIQADEKNLQLTIENLAQEKVGEVTLKPRQL